MPPVAAEPVLVDLDLSQPQALSLARKYLHSLGTAETLRLVEDAEIASGARGLQRGAQILLDEAGVRVIDREKRTVELSFSSETPVERWFGTEILSHSAGAPDLEWLNSGRAPLLWMHDPEQQIGVVQSASHDAASKRCRAVVRLANDEEGDRYFKRIEDGILKNVSFAYRIKEWKRETSSEDDNEEDTYTALRWRGVEISLVSTPADESVGIGRARALTLRCPDTKSFPKSASEPSAQSSPAMPLTAPADATAAANQALADERDRVSALFDLRRRYDPDGAKITDAEFRGFVDDSAKGELEFRRFLEAKNATAERTPTAGGVTPGLVVTRNEGDNDPLPLLHALRGLVFGNMPKHLKAQDAALRSDSPAVFKPAEERQAALVTRSDFVRTNRLIGHGSQEHLARAQNAQSLVAGGALVGVTFAPEVIPYLRPEPVMQQAGARVISGISGGPGTIRFPKQAGDIYASWAAAGVSSNAGQLPFGVLDMTPKRLVAQVQIDRQLLLQESFDIEAYVRNAINLQFALSYDLAGLIGNGNGMPLGILNTPLIQKGAVTFSGAGACPQYPDFVSFRTKVLKANAGALGARSFISSPDSVQNWATVPLAPNGATVFNGVFVLDQDSRVRRENTFETTYLNTLPTGYTNAGFVLPLADVVLYGPWGQYIFVEWAGVEWIYDPYTQASADLIVLTARLYVDGGCLQPTAFVTSSNAGSVPYNV